MRCYPAVYVYPLLIGQICLMGSSTSVEDTFDGWAPAYTREEIKPEFKILPTGGRDNSRALAVVTGDQEGLNGGWRKQFPVKGGEWYSLTVYRKTIGVELVRRNTVVEVAFTDDKGNSVPDPRIPGWNSRPYYPPDLETSSDGWTRISDSYRAPETARFAIIDLRLRWDANGEVRYSNFSWETCPAPQTRIARLAAVHYTPHGGKTPMDNCKQFEPLIAEAGRKKADLVVLGECITVVNNGHDLVSAAEAIPGPSTEYFGKLAKRHNLYIVVGLYERAGPLIYNTAALVGPDGHLVGKYRKVCPSRNEFQKGITPGASYPVFETRFGKLGMMVCYDVHMPEVARNIAANGAEVIALPIWGGDPSLAKARAIENQIILVSSTYTKMKDWMKTAIWDREGVRQATTENQREVVVYEVDLNQRHVRPNNTGDFRSRIPRERPPNPPES